MQKLDGIKSIEFIADAVFIITMAFCYVKIKDSVYIKQCGDKLPLKISFNGSYGNNGPFPNPTVKLLSVLKYDNKSRLLLRSEEGNFNVGSLVSHHKSNNVNGL